MAKETGLVSHTVSDRTAFESQAETEALFTSIGDGAITTDEFGRITRVNPAAQKMLGYSEADLIGKWFPKQIVAVTQDDIPITLIDRPITRAFLTGKAITDKIRYRTKSGHLMPVAVNVSPILLEGKPLGAIEVFRDISVEQEVDRMKSEFISLASHQLRTPLSAIKTYTHMLADGYMGDLNSDQTKAVDTILGATNRMNELISTLLNITRLESGIISAKLRHCRMDKLVDEVMPELKLMAEQKNIELSVNCTGKTPPKLQTDPMIVKEVVTNLVSNAIKYTPENGWVKIIVRPRKRDILVEIKDSGWGIPEESRPQVFSKFFRAPNIVKQETTGTGLGLYMVKGLLDTLGGDVWFESHEGQGTSFYFTVPRAAEMAAKPVKQA